MRFGAKGQELEPVRVRSKLSGSGAGGGGVVWVVSAQVLGFSPAHTGGQGCEHLDTFQQPR